MNLGEAYLDHYTHYLRTFDPAFIERFDYDGSAVQFLDFPNAMQNTHILASLGLTHYQDLLSEVVEVIVPVSELDGVVTKAVVASISFLLNLRVPLREVTCLRHLHRSVPEFFERYEKSAFVFTDPYPFPKAFADLQLINARPVGKVRMGFFLTDAEVKLVEQEGFDVLATRLEEQEVDVIDLRRRSGA